MNYSNRAIGDAIVQNVKAYAKKVYEIQVRNFPELQGRSSGEFSEKSIRDTEYNLTYLANAIRVSSPPLFENYVRWFIEVLQGLKIPVKYLKGNFEAIDELMDLTFDAKASKVVHQYVQIGINVIQSFASESDSKKDAKLSKQNDMSPLEKACNIYVAYLIEGKRDLADQLIKQLIEDKFALESIYLDVFQMSQYKIGEMWQSNKITVAQEHYCTASTQMIMGQFYPEIFSQQKHDGVFVGACVGGELHELGMRMVCDFLELKGWNTYYLGANMPTNDIIKMVKAQRADVLGLSATMLEHLEIVREIIEKIRLNSDLKHLKIVVGGYPFLFDGTLWERIGADGFSLDAAGAVSVLDKWVPGEVVNGEK